MFPIAGPGATVDNKFTEGDPIGGVPATVVTAKFMNDVQAELLSIMAASTPPQTPSTSLQNQVLAAIQSLIAAGVTASVKLPRDYFSGFAISNNSGAPNTTADVGAGSARDSTNVVDITLTSTFSGILQTSAAWAAGTGQNKLDAGAKANNSTYFIFAIRKTSDGTGDILFSLSPTAPTMPSGYSGFVRLKGRLVTGIAGNIGSFKNRGNGRFDWTTPVVEVRAGPVAIGTTLITLAGLGVLPAIAEVQLMMRADGGAGRLLPTDVTDSATGVFETDWTGGVIANAGGGSADESSAGAFRVTTNTSGQITLHTNAGANIRYAILTTGWQEI